MLGLRKLYDLLLAQAEKKSAPVILFAVAFAEASFFPILPDILLLPMVLAQREKAYRFALVCTLGSVCGAFLGYAIGSMAMATLGAWIVKTYHLERAFATFHDQFNTYGVWIIVAKGLTPIPFKLVTIASGVAGLNLPLFFVSCLLTRGARFFLVAWLLRRFGEPIKVFVEKYLTFVFLAVLVVAGLGFWIVLR